MRNFAIAVIIYVCTVTMVWGLLYAFKDLLSK
jgi:hypothetical protein